MDGLYRWQRDVVAWACERGRAAVFADCGMGKTRIQLEWALVRGLHATTADTDARIVGRDDLAQHRAPPSQAPINPLPQEEDERVQQRAPPPPRTMP